MQEAVESRLVVQRFPFATLSPAGKRPTVRGNRRWVALTDPQAILRCVDRSPSGNEEALYYYRGYKV
jgi:hypothetical protein